jgi:hypothetical protein
MLSSKEKFFANHVYRMCQENYENGGDIICESFTAEDICEQFGDLQDVKNYISLRLERALNNRWGEDNDPQLEQYRKAQEWLNS